MGTDASDSPLPGAHLHSTGRGDAPRHLMIFSYWFPPANAVGSSRPVAMARYFAARGWRVTVIAGASQAVPPSFDTDLTAFDVPYVPAGWQTRDRTSVSSRKMVSALVDLGGSRISQKQNHH